MKKANILVSLLIIGISIFFLFTAKDIKNASGTVLGARFFPVTVLLMIIVLSVFVLISTLSRNIPGTFFEEKGNILNIITTVIIFFVYILTVERIGFIPSTISFILFLSLFYHRKFDKNVIIILIVSIITPVFLWLIFKKIFHVMLP